MMTLGLQSVSLGKKGRILWSKLSNDLVEAGPKLIGGYTGTRENLLINKRAEIGINLNPMNG
jgi:hypothetical protein